MRNEERTAKCRTNSQQVRVVASQTNCSVVWAHVSVPGVQATPRSFTAPLVAVTIRSAHCTLHGVVETEMSYDLYTVFL